MKDSIHLGQKEILAYVARHSTPPAGYLDGLERASYRRVINGKMISGKEQGRVLAMLSKVIRPKTILEIGTFTGYSALCLAEGLAEDGQLHTVERNDELCAIQDEFWALSPFGNKIVRHVGDALEIVREEKFQADLIFLDADKEIYLPLWNIIKDQMKTGAVLLADNVLWHGKVLLDKEEQDKESTSVHRFNLEVNNTPGFETIILPIRDGISVIRKT